MSQQVSFRRVNGRVIPIKSGGSRKREDRGGKAVAEGLGVAVAGGAVSATLHRKSANDFNTARNMRGDLFNKKFAVKTRMEGIRAAKAGSAIKQGSSAIGSALISSGVYKALKHSDLTDNEKTAISAASGLGAHFAIRSAYTKVIGRTSFKYAIKHAFERILVRGTKL